MNRSADAGRPVGRALLLLSMLLVAACAGDNRPQAVRGAEVYQRYCYPCHEGVGGIGSPLTRRGLESYATAGFLYRYNKNFMPYAAEGSLADRQYLDVTAHLIQRFDFVEPGYELTLDNAEEISLTTDPGAR